MLNGRLYFQAWFVATVALLVAFLTLQPPAELPDPDQVAVFSGAETAQLADDLQRTAPLRVPGSETSRQGAAWVRNQFEQLPDGKRLTAVQDAVVRLGGRTEVPIRNVMYTQAATADNRWSRNILVVAPRDAPRQAAGGTSSTAILVELARLASRTRSHHPIIFLSVDGDTLGNAGLRWYLRQVDPSRIAGVLVLDGVGEGEGTDIQIWASGAHRQALGMRQMAEQAVRDAGGRPSPAPSLSRQLIAQAFTETRGAQRAAIDRRVPAVTLSAREEGPLPVGLALPSRERLALGGTAALNMLALLDARERANAPDASFLYAGRILRPSVGRLAMLLLALPLFVMALDAAARIRRARVRVSSGVRVVAWKFVLPLTVLFLAHLLSMWGVLPGTAVGRPLLPAEMPVTLNQVMGVVFAVLTGLGIAIMLRPRVAAVGVNPPAEAAGALLWLSALVLLAWWRAPMSLVLILPAAHAALAATVVPRRWQLLVLGLIAATAPMAVVSMVSNAIDRGIPYTLWYILTTTANGARGSLEAVLAVTVMVCVVSLGTLVLFRARKGLVGGRRVQGVGASSSNLSARKHPRGGDGGGRDTHTRR